MFVGEGAFNKKQIAFKPVNEHDLYFTRNKRLDIFFIKLPQGSNYLIPVLEGEMVLLKMTKIKIVYFKPRQS